MWDTLVGSPEDGTLQPRLHTQFGIGFDERFSNRIIFGNAEGGGFGNGEGYHDGDGRGDGIRSCVGESGKESPSSHEPPHCVITYLASVDLIRSQK